MDTNHYDNILKALGKEDPQQTGLSYQQQTENYQTFSDLMKQGVYIPDLLKRIETLEAQVREQGTRKDAMDADLFSVMEASVKGDEEVKARRLTFDGLVINLDSYELEVRGKRIDTPPKELELLFHLASSPNRVFTRNQLLDEVWGFDYFGDSRTVDVHIKRLREKLEGVSEQWSLKTVWGVGYKFELHGA